MERRKEREDLRRFKSTCLRAQKVKSTAMNNSRQFDHKDWHDKVVTRMRAGLSWLVWSGITQYHGLGGSETTDLFLRVLRSRGQ